MRALILILIAVCAFGQSASWTVAATGTTPAIAASEALSGKAVNNHTLQVVVAGSPSACTVRLEGSNDGTNFFDLSGSQSCTSSSMFHVDGKPVTYIRANLLTWTGGTNAVISYRGAN